MEMRLQFPVSSLQLRGSSPPVSLVSLRQDCWIRMGRKVSMGIFSRSSAGRAQNSKKKKRVEMEPVPRISRGTLLLDGRPHRHCVGTGWTDRRLREVVHCRYSITVLRWRGTESDQPATVGMEIIALLGFGATHCICWSAALHCTALQSLNTHGTFASVPGFPLCMSGVDLLMLMTSCVSTSHPSLTGFYIETQ